MHNRDVIENVQITREGSLVLGNVQNNKLYEGEYTFEASNAVGKRTSSAILTIHSEYIAIPQELGVCVSGVWCPVSGVRVRCPAFVSGVCVRCLVCVSGVCVRG